jgi:two-component system, LuxR family, response regulator FixJ
MRVGKALIYVVDDDATACESLSALLEAYGYDCNAYPSGSQVLSAVAARAPDCLVSDVQMPGMTGLDLLAAIKPQHPDLPVIIMTGFADVPMAVTAMKQGAFDFLEKPIHGDALLGVVRTALESRAGPRLAGEDPAQVRARMTRLTPREAEILEQLVIGAANKVIAIRLGISPRTVEIHRARVMDKMEANSLSHLVRMALSIAPAG